MRVEIPRLHQSAGEDEEGDRHQGERVERGEHALIDDGDRIVAGEQRHEPGQADGVAHRRVEQQQDDEGDEENERHGIYPMAAGGVGVAVLRLRNASATKMSVATALNGKAK